MKMLVRIILGLMVGVLFLNVLVLIGRGIYMSFHAYYLLYKGTEERPLIGVMESIDLFLMGMVVLILAVGMEKLFLKDSYIFKRLEFPGIQITSFSSLKLLLWDSLLLTLFTSFVINIIVNPQKHWHDLIIPGSILLLSLSSYLLRKHT